MNKRTIIVVLLYVFVLAAVFGIILLQNSNKNNDYEKLQDENNKEKASESSIEEEQQQQDIKNFDTTLETSDWKTESVSQYNYNYTKSITLNFRIPGEYKVVKKLGEKGLQMPEYLLLKNGEDELAGLENSIRLQFVDNTASHMFSISDINYEEDLSDLEIYKNGDNFFTLYGNPNEVRYSSIPFNCDQETGKCLNGGFGSSDLFAEFLCSSSLSEADLEICHAIGKTINFSEENIDNLKSLELIEKEGIYVSNYYWNASKVLKINGFTSIPQFKDTSNGFFEFTDSNGKVVSLSIFSPYEFSRSRQIEPASEFNHPALGKLYISAKKWEDGSFSYFSVPAEKITGACSYNDAGPNTDTMQNTCEGGGVQVSAIDTDGLNTGFSINCISDNIESCNSFISKLNFFVIDKNFVEHELKISNFFLKK